MIGRFRVPLLAVALVLFGLIALLGTLQYRWLGQISEAERVRMRASLAGSADALTRDVDGELTRAYLLFQNAPIEDDAVDRLAAQYAQWQAAARFPRLVSGIYRLTLDQPVPTVQQFDPATGQLTAVDWPEAMADWASHFPAFADRPSEPRTIVIRRLASPIWPAVPALVVPAPRVALPGTGPPDLTVDRPGYTLLVIDKHYLAAEMLPALVAEHFRQPDDAGIRVAVVDGEAKGGVVYRSAGGWEVDERRADVSTGLFAIRTQDFDRVASEVHRITTLATTIRVETTTPAAQAARAGRSDPPAIFFQRLPDGAPGGRGQARAITQITATAAPAWRLLVQHPSGSLETAVASARRRNLLVSSSILAVLGASLGLLVLSTRRAQELARQQMEFVATVSHELRTPLAVIHSAAENLADGVVHDEAKIRTYGEVMRGEGRRLTEMVEQILEFAGLASGQRTLRREPVALTPLLRDVMSETLQTAGGLPLEVDLQLPDDLPAVAGDEHALRRVFQNLIGNALKYGSHGGWIGVTASAAGREVRVTVADRGIGIETAEQARIFEPFYRAQAVQAAQVQGAGLGLSLVRRIVAAHGGRVSVESTAGAGAVFTVMLAAAAPPAASPHRAGATPADVRAQS